MIFVKIYAISKPFSHTVIRQRFVYFCPRPIFYRILNYPFAWKFDSTQRDSFIIWHFRAFCLFLSKTHILQTVPTLQIRVITVPLQIQKWRMSCRALLSRPGSQKALGPKTPQPKTLHADTYVYIRKVGLQLLDIKLTRFKIW